MSKGQYTTFAYNYEIYTYLVLLPLHSYVQIAQIQVQVLVPGTPYLQVSVLGTVPVRVLVVCTPYLYQYLGPGNERVKE